MLELAVWCSNAGAVKFLLKYGAAADTVDRVRLSGRFMQNQITQSI